MARLMHLAADSDFMRSLMLLFLLSGALILLIDAKTYIMAKMKFERKTARVLGWVNLILGVAVLVIDQIFSHWWLRS